MELSLDEKKILNTLYKDVDSTTRNEMIIKLNLAKPSENEQTPDGVAITNLLNELIVKVAQAKPEEMQDLFNEIPFDI
jgi:hypothetical protein